MICLLLLLLKLFKSSGKESYFAFPKFDLKTVGLLGSLHRDVGLNVSLYMAGSNSHSLCCFGSNLFYVPIVVL